MQYIVYPTGYAIAFSIVPLLFSALRLLGALTELPSASARTGKARASSNAEVRSFDLDQGF
jgi:Na+-translocating ferredoxin:NAD+ oxidoreductase RnfA subunit